MQRTVSTLALLALGSAAGCSAPAAHPPRAARPHDAPPARSAESAPPELAMAHFTVRDGDGAGASILEGSGALGRGSVHVDVDGPGTARSLELFGREVEHGVLVVEAKLTERVPGGRALRWSPTMRVRRGDEASVSVAGDGWTRTLSVRLEGAPLAASAPRSEVARPSPPPS